MTVQSATYSDNTGNVVTAVISGQTISNIVLNKPSFYSEQVNAWIAAGNTPTAYVAPVQTAAQAAQAQYAAAVSAGLAVTWSISGALNGTYALGTDPITSAPVMLLIQAETVSILTNGTFTNGQTTRNWPNAEGSFQPFTIAQFKALATAIAQYLDALATALATASAGGSPSWPSANITINA